MPNVSETNQELVRAFYTNFCPNNIAFTDFTVQNLDGKDHIVISFNKNTNHRQRVKYLNNLQDEIIKRSDKNEKATSTFYNLQSFPFNFDKGRLEKDDKEKRFLVEIDENVISNLTYYLTATSSAICPAQNVPQPTNKTECSNDSGALGFSQKSAVNDTEEPGKESICSSSPSSVRNSSTTFSLSRRRYHDPVLPDQLEKSEVCLRRVSKLPFGHNSSEQKTSNKPYSIGICDQVSNSLKRLIGYNHASCVKLDKPNSEMNNIDIALQNVRRNIGGF